MCSSALCWTCNTFFSLFFFFTRNIPPWKFSPLTWDQFPYASVHGSLHSSWPQTSSARLGSAQPACDGSSLHLHDRQRGKTQHFKVVSFFYSTCEQQFEGRTQKKVGIFVPVGFLLRMDGICSGPALSPLLLLRACCCVYRPLSWDLQPHEGLFTFIIWITWFRFLNFFSPSSHWDDWHFIHLFILLRHCFLSSSNTHMCELYPLVIMLTCYQLMLWLSCEMMWQSLMHFDCVWRERAGGT